MSERYTIHYLEMREKPEFAPQSLTILRASPVSPWYFLALYQAVGAAYAWKDMLALAPDALKAYCENPKRAMYTLIEQGEPAGFFVLYEDGETTNLDYFGLAPNAIGKGLGGALLETAIQTAWQRDDVTTLTVNTCTLDHPRALSLYLSRGFMIVSQVVHGGASD